MASAQIAISLPYDLNSNDQDVFFETDAQTKEQECVEKLIKSQLLGLADQQDNNPHKKSNDNFFNEILVQKWFLKSRKKSILQQTQYLGPIQYVSSEPRTSQSKETALIALLNIDSNDLNSILNDKENLKAHFNTPDQIKSSRMYNTDEKYIVLNDRFEFNVKPYQKNKSGIPLNFTIKANVRIFHIGYDLLVNRSLGEPSNKLRIVYCEFDQRKPDLGDYRKSEYYGQEQIFLDQDRFDGKFSEMKLEDIKLSYNKQKLIYVNEHKVVNTVSDITTDNYYPNKEHLFNRLNRLLIDNGVEQNFVIYSGSDQVYPLGRVYRVVNYMNQTSTLDRIKTMILGHDYDLNNYANTKEFAIHLFEDLSRLKPVSQAVKN